MRYSNKDEVMASMLQGLKDPRRSIAESLFEKIFARGGNVGPILSMVAFIIRQGIPHNEDTFLTKLYEFTENIPYDKIKVPSNAPDYDNALLLALTTYFLDNNRRLFKDLFF